MIRLHTPATQCTGLRSAMSGSSGHLWSWTPFLCNRTHLRTGSIQCRTYIIQVKRPLQESCSISLKPIQHKSLTLIGKLVSARAHSNSDCISNSSIVQVDIMGLMFSRRAQQIAQLLSVRLQTERLTPTRQQQLPHRCRC